MTKEQLAQRIGANVSALRKEKNITQMHLSAISGVEQATIARIELGTSNPTISTLCKLANALSVHPADLLR